MLVNRLLFTWNLPRLLAASRSVAVRSLETSSASAETATPGTSVRGVCVCVDHPPPFWKLNIS